MVNSIFKYVVLHVYLYSYYLKCKQTSFAAIYPHFQEYVSVSPVVVYFIIMI